MRFNKIFSPQNLVVFLIVLVILIVGCTPKIKRTYDLPTNNLSTLELYDSNVWVNGQYMGMVDSIGIDSLIQMYFKSKDSVNLIVQPESKYSHVVQLINNCKKSGINNIELFNAGEHLLSLDYSVQLPDTVGTILTYVDDSSWMVGVTKSKNLTPDSVYILPPIKLIEAKDESGNTTLYVKSDSEQIPRTGAYMSKNNEFYSTMMGVELVELKDIHSDSIYNGVQLNFLDDKPGEYFYLVKRGDNLIEWANSSDALLKSRTIEAKYQLLQNHFYALNAFHVHVDSLHQTIFFGKSDISFQVFVEQFKVVAATKSNHLAFKVSEKQFEGQPIAMYWERLIEKRKQERKAEAKKSGSYFLDGSRSRYNVMKTVRKNISSFRYIYNSSLRRENSLSGKASILFHVAESGSVVHAEICKGSSSITDTAFIGELLADLKTWDFGSIDCPDTTEVIYPFKFSK